MKEDEAWLARCIRGEPRACHELVERYSRLAGTIILRTLGRHDGVEDLVQETFLRVFRALPEFEGRAKLSTWICTIAQRMALDELRRRRRRPIVEPHGDADAPEAVDPQNIEADTAQAESDQIVHRALEALPDKYRLPIVHATIDGLDYETIAAMLDLPIGTIKTNIHRGKIMLREILDRELALRSRP
jgi:RNA polymerase sigma-70 factor, ECF subfamily